MTTAVADNTITARILEAVKLGRKTGATVDEIVQCLNLPRSSVSARLTSLHKSGQVETGGFRATRTGRPSTVYVAAKTWAKKKAPKLKAAVSIPATSPAASAPIPTAPPAPVAPPAAPPPATKLKNHFVLVCDHSGSMEAHAKGAAKLFDEQLTAIKSASDQDNTVTVFNLGMSRTDNDPKSIQEERYNVPPSLVGDFSSRKYEAIGGTPLYAAVIKAGQRALCDSDPDKSFAMIVLTDGEENTSHYFNVRAQQLQEFIQKQQATDRWTFVFLVPKGYKDKFVRESGVHEGNVREWDNIEKAREELTRGTVQYMQDRRTGSRSSKNWFTTDLSHIDATKLAQLREITHEVKSWEVEKGEVDVMTFVNYKTGGRFKPGCSFYEIHKKETQFQDYKKLLIYDKSTKRIYANGPSLSVRKLCGFPERGDVAIDPGNHANFLLLGQSTSTNRLLGRGTRLVFWEGAA